VFYISVVFNSLNRRYLQRLSSELAMMVLKGNYYHYSCIIHILSYMYIIIIEVLVMLIFVFLLTCGCD